MLRLIMIHAPCRIMMSGCYERPAGHQDPVVIELAVATAFMAGDMQWMPVVGGRAAQPTPPPRVDLDDAVFG